MAGYEVFAQRELLLMAEKLHLLARELREVSGASRRVNGKASLDEKKLTRVREETLTAIIDKIEKLKMENIDKAPVETGKAAVVIDENKTDEAQVEAGKAAAAIEKIHTEKVDKAPLDDEKNLFSAIPRESPVELVTTVDKILTEKCAESAPPAGLNGKHRLSDEHVGFILSMSREDPDDAIPYYDRCTNLAEVMGEEWLEEEKRLYNEDVARSRKTHNEFVQFQNWVLKEWLQKGYVEVDEDYLTNAEKLDEYCSELWDELIKKRDPLIISSELNGTVYPDSRAPFDPEKQARALLSDVNFIEEFSM